MELVVGIDTINLDSISPFYFKVDASFVLVEQGVSFRKIFPGTLGRHFLQVIEVVRPWNLSMSFESFMEYSGQIFVFKVKPFGVLYRAQCIPLFESGSLLFIGSPWLKDTDELVQHRISVSDYALNDPTTDMIQLMKLNEINIQETKELNGILIESKKVLEKKEQLYRGLVENASDMIFRCDIEGKLTFVNAATLEVTGYSQGELLGTAFWEFIDGEYVQTITLAFVLVKEEKTVKTSLEYPIRSKFGKLVWVSHSLMALMEDGEVTGYSSVVVDITTRKEMEDAMSNAQQKAEESARLKERFLANTSHEIRTPMNAIIGLSNLLSTTELNSRQSEYLGAIRSSAENLLVIINDILDHSKIESEKLELENISFNLKDKLFELTRSLQLKASEKNIVLSFDWDDSIDPFVIGDPFRLNQILTNLISNAIKFTHKGSVTVMVKSVKMDIGHQQLQFRVIDTGIGIPENKIKKIFDDFTQADASISRKYGGTGLGLSISKRLSELMGGTLNVISKEGEGAEFYFDLELPIDKTAKIVPDLEKKNFELLQGKHVLLVEDNEFNQMLAMCILEQWHVDVDQAMNGVEALNKLKDARYDVILMDIQMPLMGGVEATQILRNQMKITTPIIALTANAMKSELDEYLREGMTAFVTKPFEPDDLYEAICQVVNSAA